MFIGLYIDETKRTQETYYTHYRSNLSHVAEDIDSYINGDGAYEFRYMRIVNDMGSADSFAFLIDRLDDEKKTINELNACVLKYPEQMQEKLPEMKKAIEDILADLDEGYEEAQALVDSIDKQGN